MTTSTSASENRPHDLRRKRTPGGMLSWVLAARPPGLDADHVRSVCRGRVSLLGLTRVLITGMSSTGKSTALAELARRVHRVVDADLPCLEYRARLARWIRCGAVLARVGDERGAPQHVTELRFVAGCASDQGRILPQGRFIPTIEARSDLTQTVVRFLSRQRSCRQDSYSSRPITLPPVGRAQFSRTSGR